MADIKALVSVKEGKGLVPQNLDELWKVATFISKSDYGAKESAENVFVALQAGMELGFSLMQSRSAVYAVKGRPAIMGEAARALVFQSGCLKNGTSIKTVFLDYDEKEINPSKLPIDVKEWDDGVLCRVTAHREGQANPVSREFSVLDAKRMRLWGKTGKYGPSAWVTAPAEMLEARAWGKLVRKLFPDIVRGMYLVEEVKDFDHDYRQRVAKEVQPIVDSKPDQLLASLLPEKGEEPPAETVEAIEEKEVEVIAEALDFGEEDVCAVCAQPMSDHDTPGICP